MSDIKLYSLHNETAQEIPGSAVTVEKSLQVLFERNLESLMGIRFLATEYSTGPKHGGRIDTLGIDENGSPVIIEYKRATNENVINQGLFYLDWLQDHRADFKLLVQEKLGNETAGTIDWSGPRLLCIAGGFNRYDEHAVQQINRNIELIRYRRFGDGLLLLELINAKTVQTNEPDTSDSGRKAGGTRTYEKTISDTLAGLDGRLVDLYEETRAYMMALGDDVQERTQKYYVAFKRLRNFACVEVHPTAGCIRLYLKVNPDSISLQPGFSRDVREIGHYGTGDLELTLRDQADLESARPLIQTSYEAS